MWPFKSKLSKLRKRTKELYTVEQELEIPEWDVCIKFESGQEIIKTVRYPIQQEYDPGADDYLYKNRSIFYIYREPYAGPIPNTLFLEDLPYIIKNHVLAEKPVEGDNELYFSPILSIHVIDKRKVKIKQNVWAVRDKVNVN